jgi:2-phosphoglycerate kinase
MDAPGSTWDVLLLGGASGVGKTTLAYRLADHYGVAVIEIDDLEAALLTLTTPEQAPLLHYWQTHWDDFSAFTDEQHVEHFIEVSRSVYQPALRSVIANRLGTRRRVIIEGDYILPEMETPGDISETSGGRVRAVFLLENDEVQIAANFQSREGGDQAFRAHTSWLKNEWIREQCARLGIQAVAARPWDSLAARVISALPAG